MSVQAGQGSLGNAGRGNKVRVPDDSLQALATRRGSFLPWAPVFLSIGIGGYFALKAEPGLPVLAALAALAALLAGLGFRRETRRASSSMPSPSSLPELFLPPRARISSRRRS